MTKKAITKQEQPAVNSTPVKSESEKIWDEVKDKQLDLFGLPNQTVSQHCVFSNVEPNGLYLKIKSSAVLPALESALGPKFVVELVDSFVVVKRAKK